MTADLKRPWGTGSIEARASGYLARWRDILGKQQSKMFPTPEAAAAHLDEVYPRGSQRAGRTDLVKLIRRWQDAAGILHPREPVPPEEETEQQRASRLIRLATSQALTACANDLSRLLGTGDG